MNPIYKGKKETAVDAQRKAHEIAFAPIVFQVTRLMLELGIFRMLEESGRVQPAGMTVEEIAEKAGISVYGAKVLLESSLTAGTVFYSDGRFVISKVGWFLLNDNMVRADMNFNHYVNYKGLFHLDEAIRTGLPSGLKELGDWPTIYEGLSSLAPQVQKSWFDFDHFYSDNSFDQALPVVFSSKPKNILDIGGNTGRFALACVKYNEGISVTVMDLPQQIALLKNNIQGKTGEERISTYEGNLLEQDISIPGGFDVVWMSQFLDCFSEKQAESILGRISESMGPDTDVYILETLWDRQKFDTASFDLAQTSVYFTAMANGDSKMFFSGDLFRMISNSGMKIAGITDDLGYGHSLIHCIKN